MQYELHWMTEEIHYSYVSMILFFCAEVSMLEPVEWQGQHEFFFCAEVCMIEPVEWQGLSIVYYIRYIYIFIMGLSKTSNDQGCGARTRSIACLM